MIAAKFITKTTTDGTNKGIYWRAYGKQKTTVNTKKCPKKKCPYSVGYSNVGVEDAHISAMQNR